MVHCYLNMSSASSSQMPLTRSSSIVWLIGQQLPYLDLQSCLYQLPTCKQVRKRLFYYLRTCKLSLPQSCSNVIDEVFGIYYISHIPTPQKPSAVSKLKELYCRYVKLEKNKRRRTDRQKELEVEVLMALNKLFDVAHADCDKIPSLINISEDIAFLEDQRGERKMVIGQEDTEFKEREAKRKQRQAEALKRKERGEKDAIVINNSSRIVPSTDDMHHDSDDEQIKRHEEDPEVSVS